VGLHFGSFWSGMRSDLLTTACDRACASESLPSRYAVTVFLFSRVEGDNRMHFCECCECFLP
jgi:hypothetical protein